MAILHRTTQVVQVVRFALSNMRADLIGHSFEWWQWEYQQVKRLRAS